ncbi:hypothetical protein MMPV_001903 [Pyropia vietnamensis]
MAPLLPPLVGALPLGKSAVVPTLTARFMLHNSLQESPLSTAGSTTVFEAKCCCRSVTTKIVRVNIAARATAAFDNETDGFGLTRACLDNEQRLLSSMRLPDILNYVAHQAIPDEGSHEMFVEGMAYGTFADVFSSFRFWQLPLSAATFVTVALQLPYASTYFDDNGVIQGDVRPSNVLSEAGKVCESTSAVVLPLGVTVQRAELGVAVVMVDGSPSRCFSLGSIAPEYRSPGEPAAASPAHDTYALGVVSFLLFVSKELVRRLLGSQRTSQPLALMDEEKKTPAWPKTESDVPGGLFSLVHWLPRVVLLVSGLLVGDPAERPTGRRVHETLPYEYHLLCRTQLIHKWEEATSLQYLSNARV